MTKVIKTIVCLANSRKLSGRCIAGREVLDDGKPGDWIRPISDRDNEEVSEYERQYEDGSDPRLLDIIEIPLLSKKSTGHQHENWLLDPEFYWTKQGTLDFKYLNDFTDPIDDLWHNGNCTYNGTNDTIPLNIAKRLSDSLRLIEPDSLKLSVFAPSKAYGIGKRRVQARFNFNNQPYWLWVTDPGYERKYFNQANGDYNIGPCYVTVSLAEPYRNNCNKLVAAIIEQPN